MEFGILYDCDGTLIDSEHIAGSVCAEALTSLGYPITMREFTRASTACRREDMGNPARGTSVSAS